MKWTTIIYHVIQFIAVSIGIYKYGSLVKSTRIVFWLLVYTFLSELVALYLRLNFHNNVVVYHIFNPIQFALISFAFYTELPKYKIIIYSIYLFFLFTVTNGIYWEPFLVKFCSNVSLTKMLLTSLWALVYLYELLKSYNEFKIFEYSLVWISVGLLFFNVTNLTGLGLFNILEEKDKLTIILSNIRSFTNYILYSAFVGSFLSSQKTLYLHRK